MRFGGILFAAAVLLLGACSGDPEPKEPTKSTTPTPIASATPPPIPDQARLRTPEGAVAFTSHWVETLNYASQTGEVEQLDKLSSASCSGCADYSSLYSKTYREGGYFRGGLWKMSEIRTQKAGEAVFVSFKTPTGATEFRTSKTASIKRGKSKPSSLTCQLRYANGRWVVEQIGRTGNS